MLVYAAIGHAPNVAARVRRAFATGELTDEDFLLFDAHRGFMQYDDCMALQMLLNRTGPPLRRALGPTVYTTDDGWKEQCRVLHTLVDGADPSRLVANAYARYWHGYTVPVSIGLRVVDVTTLRRALAIAVWLAMAGFAVVAYRRGGRVRIAGVAIAACAATVWGTPYFASGMSFAPVEVAMFVGLAIVAAEPRIARTWDAAVFYAAGFGAVVAFLEMLSGHTAVAGAWTFVIVLASARDGGAAPEAALVAAVAAFVAFASGAAATVVVKQILGVLAVGGTAAVEFFGHLQKYAGAPTSDGAVSALARPFVNVLHSTKMLTYGNVAAAHVLVIAAAAAWVAAAVRGWRLRRSAAGRDVLALAAIALLPVAWVLVLRTHTAIHALFMVRIFVVTVSAALAALAWPREGHAP